jgi:hypothetical protein
MVLRDRCIHPIADGGNTSHLSALVADDRIIGEAGGEASAS